MCCNVWLVPNNTFHLEGATGLKVWSARQLVVCSCHLFPRSSLASAELLPGGCLVAFCCSLRSTATDTVIVAWKASRGFTGAYVPQTQSDPHVLKGSVIPIHNSGPPPRFPDLAGFSPHQNPARLSLCSNNHHHYPSRPVSTCGVYF